MAKKGKIFLLDDDELIVSMLSRSLNQEGYETFYETSTADIINKISETDPDIVMLDITMPRRNGVEILQELKNEGIDTQVIMLTADDTAETAVKAMKLGAADYLTKPFNTDEVKIVISKILEKERLKNELSFLRKAYSEAFDEEMVGQSGAIRQLKEKIEKMAQASVTNVLITGESGTGKEVLARYLHRLIHLKDASSGYAPFISVNCAAMPESLLESELFGYEKGSFTDAKSNKKGLFEEAKGGSILLDEIGDMQVNLQVKLLRVLEERTIRRIGGKIEIPVDATIITTTNRNLSEGVEKGEFRKDLFFRLTPFYLHIPPLRERKEDILLLATHFLSYFSKKYNKRTIKGFSPEAEKVLVACPWPGNVRELKNLMEKIVVLESSKIITPEHLPKWVMPRIGIDKETKSTGKILIGDEGISLEEVEKDLIIQALEKANNNRTQAAKLLNITYDTLRYQLKKFGIK